MPQMAPMNWLFLYILFTMIFLMFNFLNYYLFLMMNNMKMSNLIIKKSMNWKW